MKNLKISKKLLVSYAVVLVLFVVSSFITILNLTNIGNGVDSFYNGPFKVSTSANVVNARFEQTQKSMFRAISTTDEDIISQAITNAKKADTIIAEHMTIIKNNFTGDSQLISELEKKLEEFAPIKAQVLEIASQNRNSEAGVYMEQNAISKISEAQAILDKIVVAADEEAQATLVDLKGMQTQSTLTLLILCIGSIFISIGFAVYMTRIITKPITEIETAAKNLSEGVLDTKISYNSRDELGNLANSMRMSVQVLSDIINDMNCLTEGLATGNFNVRTNNEHVYVGEYNPMLLSLRRVAVDLSKIIGQISATADQVSAGSDQVASGAQILSQGATEQAASVQQLAASLNTISEQVNDNAKNAKNASSMTEKVGESIASSNNKMEDMIQAMSDINNSSNEIGKIIKTIEDIAFQTNILALNAAVEAARAGAAGKGFAVVADEVRNLASKSAEASKNTAVLIESSMKAVERGTNIVDDTAQALKEAVEGTNKVIGVVNMISSASQEQASHIAQVNQGVSQISVVVQSNSATAEQSAATSEELSSQSQALKNLVSHFSLRGN